MVVGLVLNLELIWQFIQAKTLVFFPQSTQVTRKAVWYLTAREGPYMDASVKSVPFK